MLRAQNYLEVTKWQDDSWNRNCPAWHLVPICIRQVLHLQQHARIIYTPGTQYLQVAVILLKLKFWSAIKTSKSLVSTKVPQLAGNRYKPVFFFIYTRASLPVYWYNNQTPVINPIHHTLSDLKDAAFKTLSKKENIA